MVMSGVIVVFMAGMSIIIATKMVVLVPVKIFSMFASDTIVAVVTKGILVGDYRVVVKVAPGMINFWWQKWWWWRWHFDFSGGSIIRISGECCHCWWRW